MHLNSLILQMVYKPLLQTPSMGLSGENLSENSASEQQWHLEFINPYWSMNSDTQLRSVPWPLISENIRTLEKGIKRSKYFLYVYEKSGVFFTFLARFIYTVCFIFSPLGEKSFHMKMGNEMGITEEWETKKWNSEVDSSVPEMVVLCVMLGSWRSEISKAMKWFTYNISLLWCELI